MSSTPKNPATNPGQSLGLPVFLLVLIAACALFSSVVWWMTRDVEPESERIFQSLDEPSSPSFTGASSQLKHTTVVPTLATPFPPNHNAIWAATSNLAWKELHQLVGGDVAITGLPELSTQWNQSIKLDPRIEKEDFFTAAGFRSQGIYDKVNAELATRFPGFQVPAPPPSEFDGILAFACFKLTMKYQTAFLNDEDPMVFRDSQSVRKKVKSFGIRKKDHIYDTMRAQIGTLFHNGQGTYAIDISRGMAPYQVILASIKRGPTLQATLDQFDTTLRTTKDNLSFGNESILSVPNMEWTIDHRYDQVIGKTASSPRYPALRIDEALQKISFRMDRVGVTVSSSMQMGATIYNGDEVHRIGHYIFDQPYLLIVRRRGSTDPLFVMWVDNAELLKAWK